MTRVILYVRDVPGLRAFYQRHLDLPLVEEIGDDWAVLQAGPIELALHRVGEPYRDLAKPRVVSNAKLVFTVATGLPELRDRLVAAGVTLRPLKRFDGYPQLMCDGEDPEGNVFQLAQPD
jgi:catechol 2,3-dioxygenase-like lactoylglutathione lyase family enzyme